MATTDKPAGVCVGSTFESVALIPIRHLQTVIGFIFIGDESKNRIQRETMKFLERLGSYIGSILYVFQTKDGECPSVPGLPARSSPMAAVSTAPDEMDLVTRLIDNANESIVITQDWRIIYVNNKCAEMAGIPKQDLIGLAFLELTHPDDRDEARERYSRILNGEWFSSGTTLRGIAGDGRTRWAELRELPFTWNSRPAVISLVNDITDRKRAEEDLAQSEKKYRQLIETLDEGICTNNENGEIAFVNARLAEIFGYTVDEMMGMNLNSFLVRVADELSTAAAPRKPESCHLGTGDRYEAKARRKDGTEIHLSVRSSSIMDSEGKFTGAIAAIRDITEQKKAEQALQDSERHYRFLADNITDVIWTTDLDLRPTYFSPSITTLTGYTVEEAIAGTLETRASPASAQLAIGALEKALNREMQTPGSTKSRTFELELRCKDDSTVWVESTVSFMRASNCQPVGILGAMRDITERRRARESLRASEDRYRLLVETANEAIAVIQDGVLKFVSPRIEEISGYKASDVVQKPFANFIHPDDFQMVAEYYTRRLRGNEISQTYEFRFMHKAGNTKWAEVNAVLFDWEGRVATLALINDITERKQAYEALQHQERLFRAITENSSDVIVLVDPDGMIRYESPAVERILGFIPEERIGASLFERVHPEDSATVIDSFRRMKGNPQAPMERHELRLRHKDGSWRTMESAASVIARDSAVDGIVVNLRDISDRKKAEDALRVSEERFRTLIEQSTDAIAILDASGRLLYKSPSMERVTGYKFEDWQGTQMGEWLLHPDDLLAMASLLERLIAHPELASEEVRVRFKHKDGTWHILEGTVRNLLADPKVNGLVINYRDVTERFKADQALRDSEERFRTLIEESLDAIAILDENYTITYHGPSLSRVTGYIPEEWVGKSAADVYVHPDDLRTVISKLDFLKSRPGLFIENLGVRYRHGDGSWHIMEASARNLLHDPTVRGIVVNFRDITERRRIEEALRESELRYRLLAENASDVIFTSDLEMHLTYVSPSVAQLTGFTPEETLSKSVDALLASGSKEYALKTFPRALTWTMPRSDLPAALRTASVEIMKKDGGTVWAEIKTDFLLDAAGQPIGILGVARDITDRRLAEIELEHRVQLETMITEISTAFIGISTEYMDHGIQNALDAISGFTEVDWSCIFTFGKHAPGIELAYEWRSKDQGLVTDTPDSLDLNDVPWLVDRVKKGQCVHIPDLTDLPAEAEAEKSLFLKQGIHSIIVVPMFRVSEAVGFLGLGSIRRKRIWNEETIMLLRLVAEMFSNALERMRMDSALRDSEKRYRLLAENITDVIWTTDVQANITYVSPSASALLGYAPEELGRLTIVDILTSDSLEGGTKALAEHLSTAGLPQDGQTDHWTMEVEARRKDGSTIWAEEKVTFLRDEHGDPVGLLGVARDIRERKAAENALRVSAERHRMLVEVSPDGVLCIDGRGVISDCNTGLCRMLGYDKAQLLGREARLLGTRKDLDAEANYSAHLIRGEFLELETEILRHDGQPLPVWAKLVRVAEPKTADIQTIIYFRDIADRRKIDEIKDEFIGLVSHELRSPLTVIIGSLHTAISEGSRLPPKKTRQLLQDAAMEAEQLSHLVGNLLELSRAQSNRLFLHVEPMNLLKAVHKVAGSVERQYSTHKFTVDMPRKLPPISADQLRLERILHNLLENAAKYSPEGDVITVSAARIDGQMVVSVSDHGPGISKDDQEKLFKPFQQLGSPMLDHTKGAGLGLLVCRRLVEAHGGRIWIESEPGHGATFRFTLEAGTKEETEAK